MIATNNEKEEFKNNPDMQIEDIQRLLYENSTDLII